MIDGGADNRISKGKPVWQYHTLEGKALWFKYGNSEAKPFSNLPLTSVLHSPTKWGHLYELGIFNLIRHARLKHLHERLWGNAKTHICSLQKQLAGVCRDSNFLAETQASLSQEQTICGVIYPSLSQAACLRSGISLLRKQFHSFL